MTPAGTHGSGSNPLQALRRQVTERFPRLRDGYRALRAEYDSVMTPLYRARCGTYVAVTGSCGKSTTTYLTGALLKRQGTSQTHVGNSTRPNILRTLGGLKRPVDYLVQEFSGDFPGALAK